MAQFWAFFTFKVQRGMGFKYLDYSPQLFGHMFLIGKKKVSTFQELVFFITSC